MTGVQLPAATVVVTLLLAQASGANNSCFDPNGAVLWQGANASCDPGYYCPFLAESDDPPEICTASVRCMQRRLQGSYCNAQGSREPTLCPRGSFCPSATEQEPCPAGFYCPEGTVSPVPCDPFGSLCPEGSFRSTTWGYVVLAIAVDAVLVLLVMCVPAANRGLRRLLSPYRAPFRAPPNGSDCLQAVVDDMLHHAGLDASVAEGVAPERASAGIRVTFDNLSVVRGNKTILSDLDGEIQPRALTAILGPSGAGKTTFLKTMHNSVRPTEGRVRIWKDLDELKQSDRGTKQALGFVPQFDVLFYGLTVRENLYHSALLHSYGWSQHRVAAFVDNLIVTLGLEACCDTVVTRFLDDGGVSGGERKRCSVGVTLAASPAALCIDEPTSGLDATSSLELCQLLRNLADRGVTVIMTVHQPRVEIFQLVDNVILFERGGRLVFNGPREEVVPYVERTLGSRLGTENPADYILDCLSGKADVKAADALDVCDERRDVEGATGALGGTSKLLAAWLRIAPASAAVTGGPGGEAMRLNRWMPNRALQMWWAFRRSLLQQYRDGIGFAVEVGIALLAGGLMGASSRTGGQIYRGILKGPNALISPAPNEFGIGQLGFFIGLAIGVTASPAGVTVFGPELSQFFREAGSGGYHSSYTAGKLFATLPRVTWTALHFAGLFYVLATPRASFSAIFFVAWSFVFCVFAVASTISIVFPRRNNALIAVIITMALASMCGFSPRLAALEADGVGGVFAIFYPRWLVGAFYQAEVTQWGSIYDVDLSAERSGYSLTLGWRTQCAYGICIGLLVYCLAIGLLTWAYYAHYSVVSLSCRGWRTKARRRWAVRQARQQPPPPPPAAEAKELSAPVGTSAGKTRPECIPLGRRTCACIFPAGAGRPNPWRRHPPPATRRSPHAPQASRTVTGLLPGGHCITVV